MEGRRAHGSQTVLDRIRAGRSAGVHRLSGLVRTPLSLSATGFLLRALLPHWPGHQLRAAGDVEQPSAAGPPGSGGATLHLCLSVSPPVPTETNRGA